MKNNFIERFLRGALSFFKRSLFAEETASLSGLLQSLDPRAKLPSVLLFVLIALFSRSVIVLGAIYAGGLLLAALSRIPPTHYLSRTMTFIPLFSFLLAAPAMFHFVSPGETVFSLGGASVTRTGLLSAALFVARVTASASLTILLGMTTRHADLLKSLRFFGVPQMFVMIFGMAYRYLYLFVEIVENTHRAVKSRIGSGTPVRRGRRLVAWNIAHLWMRSSALNEQVYNAMLSRGFRGEPVALNSFRLRARDWLWGFGSAAAALLLIFVERR